MNKKYISDFLTIGCAMLLSGCAASAEQNIRFMYPQGEVRHEPHFSGPTWRHEFISADNDIGCSVSSVTFAPGVKNNWHKHSVGQILIVTLGRGYYQERGQEKRLLKVGDVVSIPHDVEHWHGATENDSFTHLTISKGVAAWLEPVDEKEKK